MKKAIFETDTSRTLYRGDKGLAEWAPTIAAGDQAGVAISAI